MISGRDIAPHVPFEQAHQGEGVVHIRQLYSGQLSALRCLQEARKISKRQLAEQAEDLAILKKAAAYFAKSLK